MFDLKTAFGANLKLIRKSKNFTQEKLSELIDIHPRQLSKIETGDHFPSYKTIEKICLALNIHPSKLFDFQVDFLKERFMTDFQDEISVKNLELMLSKLKKIAQNDSYVSFVLLAADALQSKKSLEKLEILIQGIKLANFKN